MTTGYEGDYLKLISDVYTRGQRVSSRNGDIISSFGKTLTVSNTAYDFPLLRGRRVPVMSAAGEFAAMIRGPKTLKDFQDFGCYYWSNWAKADGSINLDYGNAWIDYNGVNQIEEVVKSISNTPHHRRHIIDAWRPDRLKELDLPCCHFLYQWYVQGKYLNMIWYQRSVDMMVGLPADVVLATIFNNCMAKETGYIPGSITFFLGDCHIYTDHIPQMHEYIKSAMRVKDFSIISYTFNTGSKPLTGQHKFLPEQLMLLNYGDDIPRIPFKVIA